MSTQKANILEIACKVLSVADVDSDHNTVDAKLKLSFKKY